MLFFFMRYWRKWLTLHPDFNIRNNFITRNAHIMCIELNAHALIYFLITLRDSASVGKECFRPRKQNSLFLRPARMTK